MDSDNKKKSVKKKSIVGRVIIAIIAVIMLALIVIIAIAFDRFKTMMSVKKVGDGIYSMTFYGNDKVDELLEANVSTTDELVNWIIKEQFYGLPISVDEENFGCSTFVCSNNDGDTLMGRNFDYTETDTVVVYTNPEDGYASYALADLTVVGVGGDGINPLSPLGRGYMITAPYMCLDGVNEAGLAAGILELDMGDEVHQDNAKPDLQVYCAIRVLLDKCANVDEAIELLEKYDVHTAIGMNYHLQLADKSGKAVVVEWLDNEMYVNESCVATNSVLTSGEHFDEGDPDDRIDTMMDALESKDFVLSEDEACDLLEKEKNPFAYMDIYTEWSCVYNVDKFKVDIYMDEDFGKAYSFGGKK